ncbi:MAG: manganese-dependent inorganic pyrophosphatase [Thermoanaerobacterium sp.]|jgi:DHHA2 domain./DHH family.|uniref:putative manganese-dependent inorganic diphosphatase n=1 Tax=Thermoanaerobacterium thermosaccharolyticum TaxID=1517 RepID=UPI002656A1C8|nr:manganese-dependent inorganic pyrophosphatase [Thermoanaerobacterium sp.]MDN5317395.1 manganese-dependent inorganic pyrophosphatase [Thermoanaerobacterium sp.]WHE07417.1 putative manganese-dependent inorganic diphosphatase [Thermoanaerobacterium thermosaccharolyticum]
MSVVFVSGHKNPDTDSICSAIAYADLKRKADKIDAIPVRLGPINRETQFVLNYFNVKEPLLIDNVFTQVGDIAYDKPLTISEKAPMYEAWNVLLNNNSKTIIVVDDENKLKGIATMGDLAKAYLTSSHELSNYNIPVDNIIKTLNGKIIVRNEEFIRGDIIVAAMQTESVVSRIKSGMTLIVGNRENIQLESIRKGAKTIIITGGEEPSRAVINEAEKFSSTLIVVPCDTFDTIKLINQCLPVSLIMIKDDIVTFKDSDYIDDVRQTMLKYRYRNFPVVDDDGKILGLLARRHILDYNRKKIILVDHNELSQAVDGIEDATILEIIDHHRVGGIETNQPILFRNQPVGCSSTIINKIYEERGITPDKHIAGLMCAAILSDTLVFKSPTCTPEDIMAAKKLSEIAGIDIESFGKKMFEAGTSLKGKTVDEIFYMDFKEFLIGDFKVGIGQVNTLSSIGNLKNDLLKFMEEERKNKNFDMLLLMLTDIINEGSLFLFAGNHKDLLERAFNISIDDNNFYLPYVISRKKQVVPPIAKAINSN